MEYNNELIGKRIKNERKLAGYKNQDQLISKLAEEGYRISRNTLSGIESGKILNYDYRLLFVLCKLFNCEIGYLVGEYECKTGRNTDIAKVTGLSEEAVNVLQTIGFYNDLTRQADILSVIITYPEFGSFIGLLGSIPSNLIRTYFNGPSKYEISDEDLINSRIKEESIKLANYIRENYRPKIE